jgi:hypothetical protein
MSEGPWGNLQEMSVHTHVEGVNGPCVHDGLSVTRNCTWHVHTA